MIAALLAIAAAATPAPFRCGAVERPGIAERGSDGQWRGVAVDLCRQAARGGPIAFRPYRQIDDLRHASQDAFAVLSRAEMALALPTARTPSAAPVAIDRQVLLVSPASPLRRAADLANHRVCFIIATAAEAALNAWARAAQVPIQRVGYQEPLELRDAFDAGACAAMAVDAQDIPGGADRTAQLGPALAELPLFAFTPHR